MAVTDEAIERIKAMIVSGALRPGDRLPNEVDFAAELGLSRNSLREAVRALSLLRILDTRQGAGTYVTSLEPGLLLETLSFIVDIHRDDHALQLLEVRRILEPAATAMAAVRIDGATLQELRQSVEDMAAEVELEPLVEIDSSFHRTVARACGNLSLASILENLVSTTARARIWRGRTEPDARIRTVAEHRAILFALSAHDAGIAQAAAAAHVGGVELWLRAAIAELVAEPSTLRNQEPP